MDMSTFTGSGFQYLRSQLSKCSERELEAIDDITSEHQEHETAVLSELSTVLLMDLLKQEKVNLTNGPGNLSVPMKPTRTMSSSQQQQHNLFAKK